MRLLLGHPPPCDYLVTPYVGHAHEGSAPGTSSRAQVKKSAVLLHWQCNQLAAQNRRTCVHPLPAPPPSPSPCAHYIIPGAAADDTFPEGGVREDRRVTEGAREGGRRDAGTGR